MRFPLALGLLVVLAACGKCSDTPTANNPVPFPGSNPAKPQEQGRPNVVLITIDTLRADHLEPYGYTRATSPNLLKLARGGVVYEQAYAAHTNTAPSHASMLTGEYPGTHGIRQNGMKLNADAQTLGEVLRKAGYATGAFVSGWTLTPHTGLDRGFDVYDAQFSRSRRPGMASWKIADAWLKQTAKGGKPFFMFFHMFEPHFPYDPKPERALKYLPGQTELKVAPDPALPGLMSKKRLTPEAIAEYTARYDGEIAEADSIVGRIMRRLKELGCVENTMVIFTSDHGETLFERPWIADHGGHAYDEQTHVPMIVRFPQREFRRKRTPAPVHHIDIFPTVLDVLELSVDRKLPGRSMLQIMRNRRLGRDRTRPMFSHGRPEPERVPEIQARLTKTGIITTVRVAPYKLIEYPMADGSYFQQLFNIETDPGETKNIAADNPEPVATLRKLLDDFRKRTGTADTATAAPQLSPEVHGQLKSLGYVQ